MIQKTLLTFCLLVAVSGCNGLSSRHASAQPIQIHRFDKDLLRFIEAGDTTLTPSLAEQYPAMLDILGKALLDIDSFQTPGFFTQLLQYYSEPTLQGMYRDAVKAFDNVEQTEQELGDAFVRLSDMLPAMQTPEVYMHVSGFDAKVWVGEGLVSLSIDNYMGYDYPLYEQGFYDYQRQRMQPACAVQDYLTGWLMAEFPFNGRQNVLLDRMVYEGKLRYLVSQALPQARIAKLMGYTTQDYRWVKSHESTIWKTIIKRKHLYASDPAISLPYFEERPSRFLSDKAPGDLGVYIGLQIVTRYMAETGATPEALMLETDAQAILTASRYKP